MKKCKGDVVPKLYYKGQGVNDVIMKVTSVEGIEYDIEGPAAMLVKQDPKVKISIRAIGKDGKMLKGTVEGAKTVFIIVIKDKEVLFEERQNFDLTEDNGKHPLKPFRTGI